MTPTGSETRTRGTEIYRAKAQRERERERKTSRKRERERESERIDLSERARARESWRGSRVAPEWDSMECKIHVEDNNAIEHFVDAWRSEMGYEAGGEDLTGASTWNRRTQGPGRPYHYTRRRYTMPGACGQEMALGCPDGAKAEQRRSGACGRLRYARRWLSHCGRLGQTLRLCAAPASKERERERERRERRETGDQKSTKT